MSMCMGPAVSAVKELGGSSLLLTIECKALKEGADTSYGADLID